jgi:hypothetical protein
MAHCAECQERNASPEQCDCICDECLADDVEDGDKMEEREQRVEAIRLCARIDRFLRVVPLKPPEFITQKMKDHMMKSMLSLDYEHLAKALKLWKGSASWDDHLPGTSPKDWGCVHPEQSWFRDETTGLICCKLCEDKTQVQ